MPTAITAPDRPGSPDSVSSISSSASNQYHLQQRQQLSHQQPTPSPIPAPGLSLNQQIPASNAAGHPQYHVNPQAQRTVNVGPLQPGQQMTPTMRYPAPQTFPPNTGVHQPGEC